MTEAHWERFRLYASKIRTLVLDKESPRIRSIWLSHLLGSVGRPTTLLPLLRELFLTSTNPLALHLAYNSLRVVQFIEAGLSTKSDSETRDNSKGFTTGLRQIAISLSELHFVQPMTNIMLKNISQIRTLTSLRITIGHKAATALNLGKLADIPFLNQLHIKEILDPNDETGALAFPGKAACDHKRLSAQKSHLRHLQKLTLEASGTTQVHIAATLFPSHLKALKLVIIPDCKEVQVVLVPLAVTIYAGRNIGLTSLTVVSLKSAPSADVDAVNPLRNDAQYNQLEPFLEAIANLHHLQHLIIRDVPFVPADIVLRLIRVVACLPSLEKLVIDPTPLTGLDEDKLQLPTLRALEDIAALNSSLQWLELAVDISAGKVPGPPEDALQPHNLEWLALYSSEHDECTIEEKFSVAQYLDSLFPQVRIRTSAWDDDNEDKDFAVFIDQALQFSRHARDRAIRRLEETSQEKG